MRPNRQLPLFPPAEKLYGLLKTFFFHMPLLYLTKGEVLLILYIKTLKLLTYERFLL